MENNQLPRYKIQTITNYQDTRYKQYSNFNIQSLNCGFGYLNLNIGICLVIASWLLVINLLQSILYVDVNAYGANVTKDVESFEYDAAGRSDPFMPLVTKEGKIAFGYGTIRSIEDIRLEGIVYDPSGDSIAVINGMVLRENDTFGNIKLIKIEFDKVSLVFNKTKHVIRLAE